MTICNHPADMCEMEQTGQMSFAGGELLDTTDTVIYCRVCSQYVDKVGKSTRSPEYYELEAKADKATAEYSAALEEFAKYPPTHTISAKQLDKLAKKSWNLRHELRELFIRELQTR